MRQEVDESPIVSKVRRRSQHVGERGDGVPSVASSLKVGGRLAPENQSLSYPNNLLHRHLDASGRVQRLLNRVEDVEEAWERVIAC